MTPNLDWNRLTHLSEVSVNKWTEENKAYLASITNEPHPLRTIKIQRKRWGDTTKILPARQGSPGEFIAHRTHMTSIGMTQLAAADLMFLLEDDPHVFVIEPQLGNLLRQTGLKGASLDMLKLPFRTIYLQFPKSEIPVLASETDIGQLEGVYLTEEEGLDGGKMLLLLAVGIKPDGAITDDCLFTVPFFFNGTDAIEDQVQARVDEFLARKVGAAADNIEHTIEVFSWAFNCLLYITSSEADLKEEWLNKSAADKMKKAKGTKKTKIRNMLETTSIRIVRVGAGVKLEGEGQPDSTHKGPCLHWVRGFWRQQACGVGRAERKHKWIRPYLRGEGREVVNKLYTVR